MGSSGGIFTQPALGKVADLYSYSTSYLVAAFIQAGALPFIYLAKKEKSKADKIQEEKVEIPKPPLQS
jgi:hypothetical protein